MSERKNARRAACARFAPTLAMLDAPDLDPAERAAALAHLAGCIWCQADQAADARLSANLRAVYGADGATPFRTADLLAAIGATREPAPPRWVTPPTHEAIRSVRYLDDFEETRGMNPMNERDRLTPSQRGAGTSAPTRKAAIPSLRGPDTRSGWSRWTAPFATVAVALVVIVVAATLFSLRGNPGSGTGSHSTHANATATALAQTQIGNVNGGAVLAVSMDSPTDGWAVGLPGNSAAHPTPSSSNGPTPSAVLYHYNGSVWVQSASVADFQPPVGSADVYLKMLSPTDGWLFDGDRSLLHYDGSAWRATAISLPGVSSIYILSIKMASPSLGWAAVNIGGGRTRFARYDGARWTLESITGLPASVNAQQLAIAGIAVSPQGDAWAVGGAPPANPVPGMSGVGLVFHRVGGQWVAQAPLNSPGAKVEIDPYSIYMSSPTSGWIVGQQAQSQSTSEGMTQTIHALLLRYDGQRWTPVTVPLGNDALTQIVGVGSDNIWASGRTNANEILANGVTMTALLLHFDGQRWSQVWPNAPIHNATSAYVSASGLAMSSDGALWAVGGAEFAQGQQPTIGPVFWRYSGAWSLLPATSGK